MRLTEHLALQDLRPSIGPVGDAHDNALMESIIGLYKTECIRIEVFGPRTGRAGSPCSVTHEHG